jgi:hypothetical protein
MEYLTSLWSEQIRPKTWMDGLTQEEQAEFAKQKQIRDKTFRECEEARAAALAAIRHYMSVLDRRQHNAQVQMSNWVEQRLPVNIQLPEARPDPLIASWDAFMVAQGLGAAHHGPGEEPHPGHRPGGGLF